MYDLVIIGGGPAGLSACVYAKRAMINAVVIEKGFSTGGQIINTYEVDNYLGLPNINGYDLAQRFRQHADSLGAEFIKDEAISLENKEGYKVLELKSGKKLETKAIIIANGASYKKLGSEGEEKFLARGVSYCATCDGAFYKGKTTAVVGGGDVALEDAIFLSRLCKKVYLIHRRDELRGTRLLQDKLFKLENVEILYDTVVEKINGEEKVKSISVKNKTAEEENEIAVDGVFIAVGIKPETDNFKALLDCDENGYIKADETGQTSLEGVFAAGDVRTKALRQVVTAVADGASCVYSVEKYLNSLNK